MTDHEEIRQQLLELIYGLLPPDEESRLASRIGRDPELARAYAEMKEQTDLLASAVRVPAPLPDFAAWKKLAQDEDRVERSRALQGFVRTLQALTALAAAVLILASGAAVMWSNSSPLAKAHDDSTVAPDAAVLSDRAVAAANPTAAIELEVAGPRVLNSEFSNSFAVSVSNGAAYRDEAEISYNFVSPAGETVAAGKSQAVNGIAKIDLPAEQVRTDLKLQVSAQQGRASAEVETPQLASAPLASVTSLAVDRPLVRGGDTIRWRSNTLTSQTQQPVDGPVEFEIRDPNQQTVGGFVQQGETRAGVAASMWALPRDAVAGNYSLIAKNADGIADVTRFQVDPLAPPVWNARLQFARDWFQPGEEVAASLQLNSPTGQPLANQKLQMRQIVDGRMVAQPQEIETQADGQAEVKLQLAADVAPNVTQHLYFSNFDQSWAFAAPIPLEPLSVDVNFYPEGGTLVAGLSNRVFFHATDANGKPVELKGAVVNSRDEVVATTETEYRGRGQFDFIPLPQQNYRLTASLNDSQVVADLPPTSETAAATLKVPDPVVDADQPLEVEVVSRDAQQRYGLAYYNNGALVTQQFFAVPQTLKSTRVRLDVPAEIAGAGEVTLYAADESGQVTPLAERMVFRRPQRQLAIETADLQTEYAANDHVNIRVTTKDEAGQPAPAALGVAVVNESAFAHTTQTPPTLVASQLLTKRLLRPEELPDPQTLLSDDPESERQLDYVMATDGWRQFVKADDRGLLAQAGVSNRQEVPAGELNRILDYAQSAVPYFDASEPQFGEQPILLVKNKQVAVAERAKIAPPAAPTAGAPSSARLNLAPWAFLAAVAATLGLITLALFRSAGSPWFWGPSLAVTSLAAIALAVALFPWEISRPVGSSQVAMHSAVETPSPPTASQAAPAKPMATAGALRAPAEAELEESAVYGGMELKRNVAGNEPGAQSMPLDDGPPDAPASDMVADPTATDYDRETRKLAESKIAKSGARESMTPLAGPQETVPAVEKPAPKSELPSSGQAGEERLEMNIAGEEQQADKQNAPQPSPAFLMMPAATEPQSPVPAAVRSEGVERSDRAARPQARYSLADNKADSQLGAAPRRQIEAAENELLQRNLALGTTEYGLRQAASQQAGMAQQAQQMQIQGGIGGGGGLDAGGGFGGPAPMQQVEAVPSQPMLMSRGAPAAGNAATRMMPGAGAPQAAKKEAKDFYYRAYAYSESEYKEADGLASNQAAPETIYWAPLVQTDDNGQATLHFQLPPTPGKYRITIDAVGDGRIGSIRSSFDTVPVSDSATPPPTKKTGK